MRLSGVELNIIGLGDFKANKLASGRLKDLAALESVGQPEDSLDEPAIRAEPFEAPLMIRPLVTISVNLCRRAT